MYTKLRNIWLFFLLFLLISLASGNEFGMKRIQGTTAIIEWDVYFGLEGIDLPGSVVQSSDGGFVVAGRTSSYGEGGPLDFWLLKTDANGQAAWNKTFGGVEQDYANSLIQTTDGGYALLGNTNAWSDNDSIWLVKTDSNGNHEWNKTFGGPAYDMSLIQTSDGGFAFLATTESFGAGRADMWLVKTDSSGQHMWNKTFGGVRDDKGASLIQSADGGFILGGSTASFGDNLGDYWIVKTDTNGVHEWNKTFNGGSEDALISLFVTSDTGFVLAGVTEPDSSEILFVKTDVNGNEEWNNTIGDPYDGICWEIIQTSDGGFLAVSSNGIIDNDHEDISLVKADASGQKLWETIIPREGDPCNPMPNVIQAADGGFIIFVWHLVEGQGGEQNDWDIRLIKTAPISTKVPSFGFSAVMILVILIGFYSLRRRQ